MKKDEYIDKSWKNWWYILHKFSLLTQELWLQTLFFELVQLIELLE